MVYGDLGVVLASPASVHRAPGGAPSLSPAAFCAVKLMTLRVEKGFKDKLQALLVIGERKSVPEFTRNLRDILACFDSDRRADAFADGQAAFLALQQDPEFRDRGAEGYKAMIAGAEEGYQLRDLIGFYGLRGDLVALIETRLGPEGPEAGG